MTAVELRRLAPRYQFDPSLWHYHLAEHIPPMAVIGIFRHAILRLDSRTGRGLMWFHDAEMAKKAQQYAEIVRRVIGPVDIVAADKGD